MEQFQARPIDKIILSQEQGEGAGARVRRSIGGPQLRRYSPFLMLDEFKVGLPAGFPDHPHRGFETVSFLLPSSPGQFEHEDFAGHRGLLKGGDLQWMTAGRGIMHAEMPVSEAKAHGLQLWVNLKSSDKMIPPRYQELSNDEVPKVEKDGVLVHVISGSSLGVDSPVQTKTPVHYLYFEMEPNSTLQQPVPEGWNCFAYTLEGKAMFSDTNTVIEAHHTITFPHKVDKTGVLVETLDEPCKFVLISGEPIDEPIASHGPFVMNTNEELMQAFEDFQMGKNGFENRAKWESEISKHGN